MKAITSLALSTCLVALTWAWTNPSCESACAVDQARTGEATQLLKFMCHCMYKAPSNTEAPLRPKQMTRTDDVTTETPPKAAAGEKAPICENLCAAQQGGDACNCSQSSLPG